MTITNSCHCCAERRLIKQLEQEAIRKNVPKYRFGDWVHRKYGELVIYRMRKDGILGRSIPCVLCLKAMNKRKLNWTAYDGEKWVTRENAPKSVPTGKQRRTIFSS